MPTSGPNYAGSTSSDAPSPGTNWTNLANAAGSGNWGGAGARCDVDKTTSDYLILLGYGFAIPTGATIDGIAVEINCGFASGSLASIPAIVLYKAGSQAGSSKSSAGFSSGTFGGSSDLWGTSWLPADINDSGFGVGISATGGANGVSVIVSGARITIHYTASGGGGSDSATVFFHPF